MHIPIIAGVHDDIFMIFQLSVKILHQTMPSCLGSITILVQITDEYVIPSIATMVRSKQLHTLHHNCMTLNLRIHTNLWRLLPLCPAAMVTQAVVILQRSLTLCFQIVTFVRIGSGVGGRGRRQCRGGGWGGAWGGGRVHMVPQHCASTGSVGLKTAVELRHACHVSLVAGRDGVSV